MADVKWIKITTDMFDNRKIKHLRKLPDGNNIVLIWVMLLTMAGRCNSGGMIFLTENIPYTPKMLADELGFEENTVQLALQALEQFNMVVTNQGYFSIAGWDEYQNIDGMDKIREQNRLRKAAQRERQKKALVGNTETCEYCGKAGTSVDHIIPRSSGGLDVPENTVCSCLECNMRKTNRSLDVFLNEMVTGDKTFDVSRILSNRKIMQFVLYDGTRFLSREVTGQVTECHATEEEREKEEELETELDIREREVKTSPAPLQQIVDLYHSVCVSFPAVRSLSDARKKAIKARLNTYSVEDFKTMFEKAEASSFLKGSNDRNWTATFDWLIKDANMAKVLDGNYDDKGRKEVVPKWMASEVSPERAKQDRERTLRLLAQMQEEDKQIAERQKPTVGNSPEVAARVENLKKRLGIGGTP